MAGRALTQGIKGGQDIKLHRLVELGDLSTKLSTGILLFLDLKLHFKSFLCPSELQLYSDFFNELSSALKLFQLFRLVRKATRSASDASPEEFVPLPEEPP